MKYDTLYREHFEKSAAGGPDVKNPARNRCFFVQGEGEDSCR